MPIPDQEEPAISAIIVTYNSASTINACIDALYADVCDIAHEIIIVDNASSDATLSAIARATPTVRVLRNSRNVGFSKANNLAISVANGRFVMFLNPDAIVRVGCVPGLVGWLTNERGYVAAGPCIEGEESGPSRVAARRLPTIVNMAWQLFLLDQMFARSGVFGRRYYQPWAFDTDRDVECLSGAAFLVRRESLRVIGQFDEEVPLYLDDIDLCKRLGAVGRLRYLAGCRARHIHNVSGRSIDPRLIRRLSLQANYVYFAKHWHRSAAWAFVVLALVSGVAARGAALVCGLVGRGSAEARLRERGCVYVAWAVGDKHCRIELPTEVMKPKETLPEVRLRCLRGRGRGAAK